MDFSWEALTGVGTVLLAVVTFVTVLLLRKEAKDQTEELRNQTTALELQTTALEAQAKALQISAEQFVTAEHLRMGRWLADSPGLLVEMERAEDEYSFDGKNGASVLSYFMDQILRQCELLELGDAELWLPYFRDKLAEYPQVRSLINSHSHWYSQQVLKDLAKEVSERSSQQSHINVHQRAD